MGAKVTFEFDTPQELEAFLSRFRATAVTAPGKGRGVFRDSDLDALVALADAPDGLPTRELAKRLCVGTHQLPPIINGWNRRARANGLSLGDILTRQSVSDGGKPASVYRVTDQGRELVRKENAGRKAT